jgi:xanthine phosphoribosyltransferase
MAHESFEMLVAVAQGGILPAAFIQQEWGIPLHIVRINYRDSENKPLYDDARLIEEHDFPVRGRRILLVDDVSRTGKTLARARHYLAGNDVKTFLVNGRADYSLFETRECLLMPWKRVPSASGLPEWDDGAR